MSSIIVRGLGAVSPAGWGVPQLRIALEKNAPIAVQPTARPGWEKTLLTRPVPPAKERAAFMAHPRLRRAGTLTHHAVAAALEALGEDAAAVQAGKLRLGIVVCLMAGNVTYSRRFYEETLRDPAQASPMIFPETVFNAPASHLAAYLNSTAVSYTLVGDEGTFLQGLAMAANWLTDDQADACLVIGAEELDWIVADVLRLFSRQSIHGGGAGALYLTRAQNGPACAGLTAVTDSFLFTHNLSRTDAARKMRAQFAGDGENELLCSSIQGIKRLDGAESGAWSDWRGVRRQTKTILGQAFTASAAWQCVAACDAIQRGEVAAANVSVVGANQQAIGARFSQPGQSNNS